MFLLSRSEGLPRVRQAGAALAAAVVVAISAACGGSAGDPAAGGAGGRGGAMAVPVEILDAERKAGGAVR